MGDSADMPKLEKYFSAGSMNRIGDFAPTRDVRFVENARRVWITVAARRNRCGFGDDQAGRSALAVILNGQVARHVPVVRAATRERGHKDAIGKFERTELDRCEQIFHILMSRLNRTDQSVLRPAKRLTVYACATS